MPTGARLPVWVEENHPSGFAYKRARVMLMGIGEAQVVQDSLLPANGSGGRSKRLTQAMDVMNSRYGRDTISVFSPSSSKAWAMRRDAMSPCYTTRWSHVPVAYAF